MMCCRNVTTVLHDLCGSRHFPPCGVFHAMDNAHLPSLQFIKVEKCLPHSSYCIGEQHTKIMFSTHQIVVLAFYYLAHVYWLV